MILIKHFKYTRDIRAILTLEVKTFGKDAFPIHEFVYLYHRGAETFLVAYQGQQLVAYISAYIEDKISYIASIAVDTNFRRQGIAGQLIQHIKEIIEQSGDIQSIQLHVRQSNLSAIALYKSLGFMVMFAESDYYGDEDALMMVLELLSPAK